LKVLHFSNWAPNKSGLFECTVDQIKMEREQGIDSQLAIYETEKPSKNLIDDNWLKPVTWDWASKADIFVIHRGLPEKVKSKFPDTKKILVIHGTSDFLVLDEVINQAEKTPFNSHINLINNTDASVAVNEHDFNIYKLYDYSGKKMRFIRDAIDVDRFSLDGDKYSYLRHPQIVWADSLRINKNPSTVIWSMLEVIKKIPTARLSLYGLDLNSILTWRNILLRSAGQRLNSSIENLSMHIKNLQLFMRDADILFNSNMNGVFSRVEMEAMACGCNIVGYNDLYDCYCAKAFNPIDVANKINDCWEYRKNNIQEARQQARKVALDNFDMRKKVKEEYIPLYNEILKKEG